MENQADRSVLKIRDNIFAARQSPWWGFPAMPFLAIIFMTLLISIDNKIQTQGMVPLGGVVAVSILWPMAWRIRCVLVINKKELRIFRGPFLMANVAVDDIVGLEGRFVRPSVRHHRYELGVQLSDRTTVHLFWAGSLKPIQSIRNCLYNSFDLDIPISVSSG